MANRYYYLKGKAKWFQSRKVNEWGRWEHQLFPDAASLELLRKLKEDTEDHQGIRNNLQEDRDGDGIFIRIGRAGQKTIRGKVVAFQPPEIFDRDGTTVLRDVNVGNGSDVTTKIEHYTYAVPPAKSGKRGSAIRWESTRIDNLVPYQSELKKTYPEGENMSEEETF